MANEFYALMGRMRYITRWGLMRNTFSENIQEHSHQVAVLAHALALIRREILGLEGPDPDRCAVAALYHDASEILTGDLPTPIKYHDPEIRSAYKRVERLYGQRLLDMLPEKLREHYAPYVLEDDAELEPIVSASRSSRPETPSSTPPPGRPWTPSTTWTDRSWSGSSKRPCPPSA